MSEFPYVYYWNRCGRKGRRCRVTARGKMSSIRVEFEDGFVMITSRNAVRKARHRSSRFSGAVMKASRG